MIRLGHAHIFTLTIYLPVFRIVSSALHLYCVTATGGPLRTLQSALPWPHPHSVVAMVGVRGGQEVELDVVLFIGKDSLFELSTCRGRLA